MDIVKLDLYQDDLALDVWRIVARTENGTIFAATTAFSSDDTREKRACEHQLIQYLSRLGYAVIALIDETSTAE